METILISCLIVGIGLIVAVGLIWLAYNNGRKIREKAEDDAKMRIAAADQEAEEIKREAEQIRMDAKWIRSRAEEAASIISTGAENLLQSAEEQKKRAEKIWAKAESKIVKVNKNKAGYLKQISDLEEKCRVLGEVNKQLHIRLQKRDKARVLGVIKAAEKHKMAKAEITADNFSEVEELPCCADAVPLVEDLDDWDWENAVPLDTVKYG